VELDGAVSFLVKTQATIGMLLYHAAELAALAESHFKATLQDADDFGLVNVRVRELEEGHSCYTPGPHSNPE
jgi:hypothetical protein